MFRRTLMSGLLASALALAGCAGSGVVLPSITVPTAAQVQAAAVAACGFLPDAAVVESLLNANNTIITVTSLASQICAAVTAGPVTASGRLRGTLPMVNGVQITGHFVAASRYHKHR